MDKHRNQRQRIMNHKVIKGEKLLTGRHGDSCQQPPKSGSRRELSEKGDKLGIQGGCSQEQLKKEIKEERSLTGRQL